MGSEGQSPRIPPAAKAFSFGPFEADPRTRKLRKHGVRIRLGEQPFQILAALIERPGELVTREELRELLWPGNTFVEFDDSLNSAVKKLRDALGDAARDPRYIETVPTRGYLFIATVETVQSKRRPGSGQRRVRLKRSKEKTAPPRLPERTPRKPPIPRRPHPQSRAVSEVLRPWRQHC